MRDNNRIKASNTIRYFMVIKFYLDELLKEFLHRKLTFDMLYSIKKYEEMYHTLWCKSYPNKSL